MIIDDYIATYYFERIPIVKLLETHYIEFYKRIIEFLKYEDFIPPELKLCYSTYKNSEIVCLKNKKYLIYNHYLGEILCTLTGLYYKSTDFKEVRTYGYKLLAEDFHAKGNNKLSEVFAETYKVTKKSDYFTYTFDYNCTCSNMIQEHFIIFHELVHAYIGQNKDFFKKTYTEMKSLITSLYTDTKTFDLFNSINNEDKYKNISTWKSVTWEDIQYFDSSAKTVLCREEIIEECVCDFYSIWHLINYFKNFGISISIILDGVHLGLKNLQLLAFIDNVTNYLTNNDENAFTNFQTESAIRIHVFYDTFSKLHDSNDINYYNLKMGSDYFYRIYEHIRYDLGIIDIVDTSSRYISQESIDELIRGL